MLVANLVFYSLIRIFAVDMGKIIVAGIGPGSKEDITPAVLDAVREADAIVGYKYYFQFIEPYVKEGCECIDDRLVTVNGLRILGLGGCAVYSGEPYQYTERQMRRRIARLNGKVRRAKGVDIVLTHCPPKGYGDADDYAHRGFEIFLPMLEKWKPKVLVHGHVHLYYGTSRESAYDETRIVNAWHRFVLTMDPETATLAVNKQA